MNDESSQMFLIHTFYIKVYFTFLLLTNHMEGLNLNTVVKFDVPWTKFIPERSSNTPVTNAPLQNFKIFPKNRTKMLYNS